MQKKEIIKELDNIIKIAKGGIIVADIAYLRDRIAKEGITSTKYSKNCKQIHLKSQRGIILNYLQTNYGIEVMGSEFMSKTIFRKAPFVGYSATARLSELLRFGLVRKAGFHKGVMSFFHKSKDRCLYSITEKGLKYKLQK